MNSSKEAHQWASQLIQETATTAPTHRRKSASRVSELLLAALLPLQPLSAIDSQPDKPDLVHNSYIPLVEKSLSRQELLGESIAQYFTHMTPERFLMIPQPDAEPGRYESTLAAWIYWANRFYPHYQESLQLMKNAGISSEYFPDTASSFVLDLATDRQIASTYLQGENGKTESVYATMHYAYADAFIAEFIHFLQGTSSMEKGITRPMNEGISNVVHLLGALEWYYDNERHLKSGKSADAVIMPIIDAHNTIQRNPSVEEFNYHLFESLVELKLSTSRADSYLKTYLGESELGRSQQYPAAMQLLTNYIGNAADFQYHETLESQGAIISEVIHQSIFSSRDGFLVAPLLRHGQDIRIDSYPTSVQKAVADLRSQNLLLDSAKWKGLLGHYSRINYKGYAVHPATSARFAQKGDLREIIIYAYLLMSDAEATKMGYTEIGPPPPTAKLYFLEPNEDGKPEWWSQSLTVTPIRSGDTLVYTVNLPTHIRLPGFPPEWIPTENRPLVLGINIETARGLSMNYVENFELQGSFGSSVAEVRTVTEAEPGQAEDGYPVAERSEDPAVLKQRADATVITATEPSELSPEDLQQVEVLREQLAKLGKSNIDKYEVSSGVNEPAANENSRGRITVGDQKVAKREDGWDKLEEELNKIWNE